MNYCNLFLAGFLLVSQWIAFHSIVHAQDKYAIVIGVETYDTGTFENLQYAAEDATELGETLTGLGFRTTVMTSESRSSNLRPTTPEKIADVIKSVAASCGNDDTLLISLSGHGVQFSDEALLPTGVRESYFCPGDADLSDKRSLMKVSSIVNFMNASAAGRKLLLVDACQENVLSSNGRRKAARKIEAGSVHENRRSVPGGMAVLFSCSSGQFSWEHDPIQHSVFTYHVIQYLSGKADSRFYEGSELDLAALVYFVSKRTNDYVREKRLSTDGQLPVQRGSSATWPLGRIQPQELTNSLGMKFVLIPAGEFLMGSTAAELEDYAARDSNFGKKNAADELPQHRVTISQPFYLGATEVTRGQFARFVDSTGYKTDAEKDRKGGYGYSSEDGFQQKPEYTWRSPGFAQRDSHPVVNVSWNDAVAFCEWLTRKEGKTYQLPTEAEWEYACRGNVTRRSHFSIGDAPEQVASIGNVADGTAKATFDSWSTITSRDGYVFTSPVGRYRSGGFGLFDMHGNVWEWCRDWYGEGYYSQSSARDPQGPSSGTSRVSRGGSWSSIARDCRSAYRDWLAPDFRDSNLGFRVSLVPDK